VSTLFEGIMLSADTYEFHWHGRDDSGASLPSGIYFCRLSGKGMYRVKKIVKTN